MDTMCALSLPIPSLSPPLLSPSPLQSQGKATGDIRSSPRAMAKLLKEAQHLKVVLSANTEHVAQVCVCVCACEVCWRCECLCEV